MQEYNIYNNFKNKIDIDNNTEIYRLVYFMKYIA